MKKSKAWRKTKFPGDVIVAARDELAAAAGSQRTRLVERGLRTVDIGMETWEHDTDAEFLADYRRAEAHSAHFYFTSPDYEFRLYLERSEASDFTRVTVGAPTRDVIERVLTRFEDAAPASELPGPPIVRPVIFIGHGRSPQWRDLKDHLQDQHGYRVEAYEVGARAGHGIRDILDDMLRRSTFALLVLTAEDEDADGNLHARDNVIHETGLFQGRLGWSHAIAVVEQGVMEFSNIHGIQQIRFQPGNIRASFGDVLATIHREFGSAR